MTWSDLSAEVEELFAEAQGLGERYANASHWIGAQVSHAQRAVPKLPGYDALVVTVACCDRCGQLVQWNFGGTAQRQHACASARERLAIWDAVPPVRVMPVRRAKWSCRGR